MELTLAAIKKGIATFQARVTSGASLSQLSERGHSVDWLFLLLFFAIAISAGVLFGALQFFSVTNFEVTGTAGDVVTEITLDKTELAKTLEVIRTRKAEFTALQATPPHIVDPAQ